MIPQCYMLLCLCVYVSNNNSRPFCFLFCFVFQHLSYIRNTTFPICDYWLATSGGRFCNILFSCNRHIVPSDSIFWFNKLGVNVGILLLYFLNRLQCVPVTHP